MNQQKKALTFAADHQRDTPLILRNVWDAGSAKIVAENGAKAVATSSWSMAASQGFADGQLMPFSLVEQIIQRIAAVIALPLSVDFEGGYAAEPAAIADHLQQLIDIGIIGINIEDGVAGTHKLRDIAAQCRVIEAIRARAEKNGIALFINARTDLFLNESASEHASFYDEALARAIAYRNAGASGLFVPGMIDEGLIGAICASQQMPVNIMMMKGAPSIEQLTALGVRRISYGPLPYLQCMAALKNQGKDLIDRSKASNLTSETCSDEMTLTF